MGNIFGDNTAEDQSQVEDNREDNTQDQAVEVKAEVSTGDFQLEADVPVPKGTQGRKSKYPFGEMAVNDSFLVPLGDKAVKNVRANVLSSAFRYRKQVDENFHVITRIEDDGVRVWRKEK